MKLFRVLIFIAFAFALVTCTIQNPSPTATATSSPTVTVHYFPPITADEAQKTLTQTEQAIAFDNIEMPLSQYSYYYRAALYAAWNALLYFPNDTRAETWKWKMAYYAAMGGEQELAANIYSEQITKALNQEKIRVEDLPAWFKSGELENKYITPQFKIETQLVNIPGNDHAYLVQLGVLDGIDIPGSMCLLITEQEKKFTTFLVYNGFSSGGFFPTLRDPSNCTLTDLTGDGIDEIVAHNWMGEHVGFATIQVFDISSLPPKALPFKASEGQDFKVSGSDADYSVLDRKAQIQVSDAMGQCEVYATRYFEWNGNQFEMQKVELKFSSKQNISQNFCGYQIVSYAQKFDTKNAIQILDQMLQAYTPASDQDKQMLEEIKVKKGLIYLLANQPNEARSVFQDIVQSPLAEDDIWVKPVKNFLKTYKQPSDLYRACSVLTACDPYRAKMIDNPSNPACVLYNPCYTEALGYVMANQSPSQLLENFTANLKREGVEISSEGWIDLDNDGKNELWFMINPPSHNYYDLWIGSEYPNGIRTFQLGAFPNDNPEFKIKIITPNRTSIELGDHSRFVWSRDSVTNEPSLTSISEGANVNYDVINTDLKEFEKLQSQLYSNKNPTDIYQKLLAIENRYDTCPYQLLDPAYKGYDSECGNYYYALGFAGELANDNSMATRMYTKILDLYATHPMALLAREKLNH